MNPIGQRRTLRFREAEGLTQSHITVCVFPVAAVTNYHKLGGLKQRRFIFSLFRKPEV